LTLLDRCQRAAGRLDTLRTIGVLDSPQAFDRLAQLAGRLLKAPIALISLLEEDRQVLVSAQGLPEPFASQRQIPLAYSLCKHVVDGNAPLVISDARSHPLGQDNLAVHQLNATAYLGVPLLGPDGEVLGTVCVIDSTPRDWSEDDIETLAVISQAVTSEFGADLYRRERDRVHEALRAGEARSTEILESIDDAFYAIDRDWRFRYVNRHAERLWGRRREDILGRPIFEIFPAFAGSASHHACMRVLAESVPARIETVSPLVGAPVEINVFPSPSGLSVYFRDVSGRRRMEQALRERDEILSLAERSAGIGVWDVDLATGTVRGTPQFFQLFGLTPSNEPVPIETLRAVRHPDDQDRVIQGFREAVESGTDHYEMEYRILRPNGELRWIFGRGRVVRDPSGRPIRYSGIDIDITERKRMEAHQKLLLAELNHRVKNTIATIQGIANLSLSGEQPLEEAREQFVRRLHALAHTHTLLTESEWRGAKLSALVQDELRPYGEHASFKGPEIVLAPRSALILGLALHELATNAAKHGALHAPTGRVEVTWEAKDGIFRLCWRERGGPPRRPPARRGFGSRLLERAVPYELQGQSSLAFLPEGVRYELTAPLRELASPA
jgi:PAS domain S-box-containing protein